MPSLCNLSPTHASCHAAHSHLFRCLLLSPAFRLPPTPSTGDVGCMGGSYRHRPRRYHTTCHLHLLHHTSPPTYHLPCTRLPLTATRTTPPLEPLTHLRRNVPLRCDCAHAQATRGKERAAAMRHYISTLPPHITHRIYRLSSSRAVRVRAYRHFHGAASLRRNMAAPLSSYVSCATHSDYRMRRALLSTRAAYIRVQQTTAQRSALTCRAHRRGGHEPLAYARQPGTAPRRSFTIYP